jgi:hypothetical protein
MRGCAYRRRDDRIPLMTNLWERWIAFAKNDVRYRSLDMLLKVAGSIIIAVAGCFQFFYVQRIDSRVRKQNVESSLSLPRWESEGASIQRLIEAAAALSIPNDKTQQEDSKAFFVEYTGLLSYEAAGSPIVKAAAAFRECESSCPPPKLQELAQAIAVAARDSLNTEIHDVVLHTLMLKTKNPILLDAPHK